MYRLELVRSVAEPVRGQRPAKVISLEVRRQARIDQRRPKPAPDRPRAA
jgi:hypothetical protein